MVSSSSKRVLLMFKEKPATLRSAKAYDLLRHDLIEGTLKPGTKLIIADLCERYGLGAMPLREALNRLSAEQFVEKHDQRGFTVPPLQADLFLEIQNARIVIESSALRESVTAHHRDWEDRLVLAFHHLAKASHSAPDYLHSDDWSHAHGVFHKSLISGCENQWLLTFSDLLFKQSARYRARRRQIDAMGPGKDSLVEEHRQIMEAATQGDADLAEERLITHYRRSVETVLGQPVSLCLSPLRFSRMEEKSSENGPPAKLKGQGAHQALRHEVTKRHGTKS